MLPILYLGLYVLGFGVHISYFRTHPSGIQQLGMRTSRDLQLISLIKKYRLQAYLYHDLSAWFRYAQTHMREVLKRTPNDSGRTQHTGFRAFPALWIASVAIGAPHRQIQIDCPC